MVDGKKVGYGFAFCTNGFSESEVYKLAALLHYKFHLTCSVQKADNKRSFLYVNSESIKELRKLVLPYIHPDFQYKFRK